MAFKYIAFLHCTNRWTRETDTDTRYKIVKIEYNVQENRGPGWSTWAVEGLLAQCTGGRLFFFLSVNSCILCPYLKPASKPWQPGKANMLKGSETFHWSVFCVKKMIEKCIRMSERWFFKDFLPCSSICMFSIWADFQITPAKSRFNTVRLTLWFTGICSEQLWASHSSLF